MGHPERYIKKLPISYQQHLLPKRETLHKSMTPWASWHLLQLRLRSYWKQKYDWDEPLDQELINEWSTIADIPLFSTTESTYICHNTTTHLCWCKPWVQQCICDDVILTHWWCPDLESLLLRWLLYLDWNSWLQLDLPILWSHWWYQSLPVTPRFFSLTAKSSFIT